MWQYGQLILNAIVEKRFFKTVLDVLDKIIFRFFLCIAPMFFKVKKDKIVFTNFTGNYECNPKYICEEILKRDLPWELVWVKWGKGLHENIVTPDSYPPNLILCDRYSLEFYKHLFSAKIIIDNGTSFASANYKKKKNQVLINTWHGSLGIKRFPKDDSLKNKLYNKRAICFGKMTDFVISNSDFEDMYYKETYFQKPVIKKFGHARNDLFFKKDLAYQNEIRNKVCKYFSIPFDSKICLYAPTFRDDGDLSPYNIPYEELINALSKRFGGSGKWVVLNRFHHRTKNLLTKVSFPIFTVSATNYPDIHELMMCADVGITDYSSWICEYIHTRKPGFLYATDVDKYDLERGFYDPLDSMPFPLATKPDELINKILHFDQDNYLACVTEFLKKKGCIDDGHASERIVDFIEELVEGKRSQL